MSATVGDFIHHIGCILVTQTTEMLADWAPFIIWAITTSILTIGLKIALTTFVSALSIGLIVGDAALIFFMPYTVDCQNSEVPISRLAETSILILSAMYLVGYISYQVFRDNKHRRLCHYCKHRKDMVAPQTYDYVSYDTPEASISEAASLIGSSSESNV
jgi:hypothetical protein